MNKIVSVVFAATLAVCAFATPVFAASPFWVINDTQYEITHVYVQRDTSGGERDLMGDTGIIPPYDQAKVLRPRSEYCRSNVGVVAYDYSDATESWKWFRNVNICSNNTALTVTPDDFIRWVDAE